MGQHNDVEYLKRNKLRTIFCKNTFLNWKPVFPKLDLENGKEKCFETLFKNTLGMWKMCVSIPKELRTYIILVLTNDYKSYLKCKRQKCKSWYHLLLQTWSLSSSMCLGPRIYILLAFKVWVLWWSQNATKS